MYHFKDIKLLNQLLGHNTTDQPLPALPRPSEPRTLTEIMPLDTGHLTWGTHGWESPSPRESWDLMKNLILLFWRGFVLGTQVFFLLNTLNHLTNTKRVQSFQSSLYSLTKLRLHDSVEKSQTKVLQSVNSRTSLVMKWIESPTEVEAYRASLACSCPWPWWGWWTGGPSPTRRGPAASRSSATGWWGSSSGRCCLPSCSCWCQVWEPTGCEARDVEYSRPLAAL